MDDQTDPTPPAVVADLLCEAETLGFRLSCEPLTGSLLRTLAASKPGGTLLELGTGVGVGTDWNACSAAPCLSIRSRKKGIFWQIGVFTPPGLTALTRTPLAASWHSMAAIFESRRTAALLTP